MAASHASFIITTAPSAKFGAISRLVLCLRASSSTSFKSASLKPVVPTTACTPSGSILRRLPITTSGRVKSTTTSGLAASMAATKSVVTLTPSPRCTVPSLISTAPTSSKSASLYTFLHTSLPMRPSAPFTKTRIMSFTP